MDDVEQGTRIPDDRKLLYDPIERSEADFRGTDRGGQVPWAGGIGFPHQKLRHRASNCPSKTFLFDQFTLFQFWLYQLYLKRRLEVLQTLLSRDVRLLRKVWPFIMRLPQLADDFCFISYMRKTRIDIQN